MSNEKDDPKKYPYWKGAFKNANGIGNMCIEK